MSPVIARDAVAADHLVYAWPFPIGPEEYEVSCADDEQVVMCPAWMVNGLLGPGRHRWRTPDPMRPVAAYFVLTAPVEVSFDMVTQFIVPSTGQGVRLRGTGSLQVKCSDPSLLIAQFVGLPFDAVNDGILRSVSRSVERMLARLLTRRVIMGGTPAVVTDPGMLPSIIEELVAYNPAAGAVFGVELMRMGHLEILADDGSRPLSTLASERDTERGVSQPKVSLTETIRAPRGAHLNPTVPPPIPNSNPPSIPPPPIPVPTTIPPANTATPPPIPPPPSRPRSEPQPHLEARSGEIIVRPRPSSKPPAPPAELPAATPVPPPLSSKKIPTPVPGAVKRASAPIEVPQPDEITQPGVQLVRTPVPGSMRIGVAPMGGGAAAVEPEETRGSILGIGVAHIGSNQVASGEISKKVLPGARVLVPGPNGLMQSATVRQLLQGYYELEVGASGETIWVPVSGVVPE